MSGSGPGAIQSPFSASSLTGPGGGQAPRSPDEARAQAFLGQPSLFGFNSYFGVNQQQLGQELQKIGIDPKKITAQPGTPQFMDQLGKALKPYEAKLRGELAKLGVAVPRGATLADMRGLIAQKVGGGDQQGTANLDTLSLPQLLERLQNPAPTGSPEPSGPGAGQPGQPDQMEGAPPPQAPRPVARHAASPPMPVDRDRGGVATPRSQTRVRPERVGGESDDVPPQATAAAPPPPPAAPAPPAPAAEVPPPPAPPAAAAPLAPAPLAAAVPSPVARPVPNKAEFDGAMATLWFDHDFKAPASAELTAERIAADPKLKAYDTLMRAAPNQRAFLQTKAPDFYRRIYEPSPTPPMAAPVQPN